MGGLGGLINSITGASSSARQQNQYAVGMANLNFEQQKEMLLKGPTWQMQGYKDAGVNPMYGFGGGTLHGGGGNSAGGAGAGAQLGNLGAIADIFNNTRATSANTKLIDAQTLKTIAETKGIPEQVKAQAIQAQAAMMNAKTQATSAKTGALGKVFGTENTEKTWKGGGNFLRSIFN